MVRWKVFSDHLHSHIKATNIGRHPGLLVTLSSLASLRETFKMSIFYFHTISKASELLIVPANLDYS